MGQRMFLVVEFIYIYIYNTRVCVCVYTHTHMDRTRISELLLSFEAYL